MTVGICPRWSELDSSLLTTSTLLFALHTGTCDATSTFDISLVQPASPTHLQTVATFSPEFTFSIFGDEETVFGYKGLKIHLRFAAHDLRPNLSVQSDEVFEPVDDVKPTDIKGLLKDFVTEGALYLLL